MTTTLGISAFFHDSAACLVRDGRIIAAAQEERFSRIKHDAGFPESAIRYCFDAAKISPGDLDHVVFYEKPIRKFDRLMESFLATAPRSLRPFTTAMPSWIKGKLNLRKTLRRRLDQVAGDGRRYGGKIHFVDHHLAHAASAAWTCPWPNAAVLVCDAVGEWATTSLGWSDGQQIQLTHQLRYPHSLGLLYSAFTYFCGFTVNSGEYKLMGLAAYGTPKYAQTIESKLLNIASDGSFRLNQEFFGFVDSLKMTNQRFADVFDQTPRRADEPITDFHRDLAASIQKVTEDILLRTAKHLHRLHAADVLCIAGGVALNGKANGRLMVETPFRKIYVPPAPGDAGGAVGAALLIDRASVNDAAVGDRAISQYSMQNACLGPVYDSQQSSQELRKIGASFRSLTDDALIDEVARRLANGQVVGWMDGPMEFGPRAVGRRSILADPRGEDVRDRMNKAIKFREPFRPFAPVVLADRVSEYFQVSCDFESPWMSFIVPVKAAAGIAPAIIHADGTARVQTLTRDQNPKLYRLIQRFDRLTGCPMLVNTSFNVKDEPIVASPVDAYRCFRKSGMDCCVIQNHLLDKRESC
ncbi:carbamoyltransferase family protein [Crateriforma spongiae]|uniref:carbamoyltransferase family protein n=1 Tax=Crateriforma spongiae TaxID=2724528 RepID=UPI00198152AD|nr:carbamoyltransferase N-terminal domain-containing protein [Crateriforma spongiae]